MVIIWLPEAQRHLKEIYLFYKANRSLKAAIKVRQELFTSVTPLKKFSQMAPIEIFSTKTTQEYHALTVGKYFKIVYFIDNERIYISAIFDCRQDPKVNEQKIK
ncbi:MAG: type II toxin-antitoxin system RelE/ParE family toxin [Prevotella sp.]|jgi:plasmid stabilization system protein ParE|nr:type II toxin-antitoxin system RelE/ParE family toxin [Prevotella sp.]